jgi:hypothetical protein
MLDVSRRQASAGDDHRCENHEQPHGPTNVQGQIHD